MASLNWNVFAGRSVLVTGHTGFKGSWLALWLSELGAVVHGYSLPSAEEPCNFTVSGVRELMASHHEADIRDRARLDEVFRQVRPDVVFHLAAQPLVRESYASPRATFDTNVMGVCDLLECIRQQRRPCAVIVVTSDKCYENREQVWGYRENEALGGRDPYSASKAAAEIVVSSYRRSFFPPEKLEQHGVQVATVRAGNVIGGGDWARDRIVPDLARSLAANLPVPVRNPRAVRPWQHVLEPLSGYLTVAARMLESGDAAWSDAWNFGPQVEGNATVRDLVETFLDAWGGGQWQDVSDPSQPHEASQLRLSIEKAMTQLAWRPVWNFRESVVRTSNWYRAYYRGSDHSMRDSCREDLRAFREAAADVGSARRGLRPNG